MNRPMPVTRYLVPDGKPNTEALTIVTSPIRNGLPHAIALDSSTRLVVVVPTGVGNLWRDADPTLPANQSDWEISPSAGGPVTPAGEFRPAPLRIVVQRGGTTI